jgi:hypothetical protein
MSGVIPSFRSGALSTVMIKLAHLLSEAYFSMMSSAAFSTLIFRCCAQ